jgi:outer membrane protein TolC
MPKLSQALYYFIFLLVCCQPALYGQNADTDTLTLTLKEALDLAKRNYPLIRSRAAQIEAASNEASAVRASYLPKAGLQAQALFATSNQVRGAYYSVDGLAVPVAGGIKLNEFDSKPAWTSLGAFTVDWKAITFGRLRADKNAAQTRISYSEQLLRQEIFEHQIRVIDAYLLVLNTQKLAELQQKNVVRTQNILTVTSANAASGLKAGIDSSVAAVEATKAKIQWMNSLNIAQMQNVVLSELIGRAGETVRIDTMRFYRQLPYQPLVDTLGMSSHPRLKPKQLEIEMAGNTAKLIQLNNMPTLSLMGSVWGRGSGISQNMNEDQSFKINSSITEGLPFRAYNYLVGATISWHPTRYFETRHRYRAQQQHAISMKENYKLVSQQLTTSQKNASLQFDIAYQTAQQTPLQVAAARQALAQSNARYESGLESIMVLTQVGDLYNNSQTDYLVSVNNLWRALLLKASAHGDLDLFLEQIPN